MSRYRGNLFLLTCASTWLCVFTHFPGMHAHIGSSSHHFFGSPRMAEGNDTRGTHHQDYQPQATYICMCTHTHTHKAGRTKGRNVVHAMTARVCYFSNKANTPTVQDKGTNFLHPRNAQQICSNGKDVQRQGENLILTCVSSKSKQKLYHTSPVTTIPLTT